jgi:uncharacterized membrane protein YbhN (UPF0104 family)
MNKRVKNIILFFVKFGVSGGLLYMVLRRAGTEKVLAALGGIDPWAFSGAVIIFLFTVFACSIRWRLLLPDRFGIGKVFSLFYMGSFFNTFLPGMVGGDVMKIYYLYRETGRGSQALASVFMDRYMGYFAMMTLGLMAFPFGFRSIQGTWMIWVLPAIVVVFYVVSLVLFWMKLGGGIRILGEIYGYFDSYRARKKVLVRAFFISLGIHISVSVLVYFLNEGLGVHIPFTMLLVFVPIINTLSALPLSVSGIGIREAAIVLLFGTMGVSPERATAVSFAWFLTIAISGLGGVVPYLKIKGAKAPS